MYAAIVPGTRDAVSVINKTHRLYFDARSLVAMRQPCSVRDILLQPHCIPDFNCPVIGAGDEEVVVGSYDDSVDWSLVFSEV